MDVQVAARGPGPHYKMIRLNEKMPLNLGGLEFFSPGGSNFYWGVGAGIWGLNPPVHLSMVRTLGKDVTAIKISSSALIVHY